MPEGRLIKKKIVDNERLGKVSFEAEFLFWRMIPFLDREGRLSFVADAKLISKKLYSWREITPEQIDGWLKELAAQKKDNQGLIELYEVEGRRYLWMPGFKGEQSTYWLKTTYKREGPSEIPPPPGVRDPKPEEAPNPDDIIDERLKEMVKLYQDKIGMPTPAIYERLKDISKEYPEAGWFEKAVAEAAKNKAYSIAYIEKILERYREEGFDGGARKSNRKSKSTDVAEGLGDPLG